MRPKLIVGKNQEFHLKTQSGSINENPTLEQVIDSIEKLDHHKADPCIILEDHCRPNAFIQTVKQSARLYVVEYSEGEPQCQFSAAKVPKLKVKQLFDAYYHGDQIYKTMIKWEDITEELFGEHYRTLAYIREFIAFNEIAAKYGGYRIY